MKQLYTKIRSVVSEYAISDYELSYDKNGNQVRQDFKYPQNFVDIYMPLFKSAFLEKYQEFARPNHHSHNFGMSVDIEKINAMSYPTGWLNIGIVKYWESDGGVGAPSFSKHDVFQFVMANLEKFPLDIIFPDDIVKIEGKFYKIPKKYENSEFSDFETNYVGSDEASVWRETLTSEIEHNAFILVTNDVEYDVKAVLKQVSCCGETQDEDGYEYYEYETLFENEYLYKRLVEIDVEKTLKINQVSLVNFENSYFGKYFTGYGNLDAWDIKTPYHQKDYKTISENPFEYEEIFVPEYTELVKSFDIKVE